MDVQADDAGLRPDPYATAVVERPVTDTQGRLFNEGHPTYADTDKIPAYRASPSVRRGRGDGGSAFSWSSSRWSCSRPRRRSGW